MDSGFVAFLRIFGKFSFGLLGVIYDSCYNPQQTERKFAQKVQKIDRN